MKVEQLSFFDDLEMTPVLKCPLIGRKVVVTGSFELGKQGLRNTLMKLGASDVRYDKLQRNTHYLLVGEAPNQEVINYWKLYVHDGYNICRIDAEDLRRIQNGDYATYQTAEEMSKQLHLTEEHIYWKAPEIATLKNTRAVSPLRLSNDNTLYNKEIFVHISIIDKMPNIAQALGCLGAYANTEIAEDTDYILIPKSIPQAVCQAVEKYYNNSRTTTFDTPFVILEDLIEFLIRRLAEFPDEVLEELMVNEEQLAVRV